MTAEMRDVFIHVDGQHVKMSLSVNRMGYACNETLVLKDDKWNRFKLADVMFTVVSGTCYQVVQSGNQLHLYLPSPAVEDKESSPWRPSCA